jgi:hypothetical protein
MAGPADISGGMEDAAAPVEAAKGPDRLLADCVALTHAEPPAPAYTRVERHLGARLARLLVGALASRRDRRASRAA